MPATSGLTITFEGVSVNIPILDILAIIGIVATDPGDTAQWESFLFGPPDLWPWDWAGVPRNAKTWGAGVQLLRTGNPIAYWYGVQILDGVNKGRVLSEGGGPLSFEGKASVASNLTANIAPQAMGHPFRRGLNLGNQQVWHLDPIPPPPGAPYGQAVIVPDLTVIRPDHLAGYLAQLDITPPPTPLQFLIWLQLGKAIRWSDLRDADTFARLYQQGEKLSATKWRNFIKTQKTPPPPPGPPIWDQIDDDLKQGLQTIENNLQTLKANILPTNVGDIPPAQQGLANVVSAGFNTLSGELQTIDADLQGLPSQLKTEPPPTQTIDLAAVIKALKEIAEQLGSLEDPEKSDLACICRMLTRIAKALEDLKPPDLSKLNELAEKRVAGMEARNQQDQAIASDVMQRYSQVVAQ